MSEAETVAKSALPVTVDTLVSDLQTLGVQPGDVLLVHTAMSAIGWVCGGQVAVDCCTNEGAHR
jgi:aminoglycoside 3-N-acetyltransferase